MLKLLATSIVTSTVACSVSLFGETAMTGDGSMKKSDAMGKQMTIAGCISEKDGKYN
jgi:hypothetical protein